MIPALASARNGRFIPLVIGMFSAVWFVSTLNSFALDGVFSTDMLYLPSLARDLLAGHSLAGWNLPGAPYLFPDLAYFLLLDLIGTNFESAIVLLAIIQCVLTFVLIGTLLLECAGVAGTGGALWILSLLTAYESLASSRAPSFFFRAFALVGNHYCAFLMSLALAILALKSHLRPSRTFTLSIFILTALTAASDRYLFVAGVLPLLAAEFLSAEDRRTAIRNCVPFAAGALCGLALFKILSWNVESVGSISALSFHRKFGAWTAMTISLQAMLGDLRLDLPAAICSALSLLSAFAGLFLCRLRKLPIKNRFVLLYASLATIGLFAAPIATATYQAGAYRYIAPGMLLVFLTAPIIFAGPAFSPKFRAVTGAAFCAALLALCLVSNFSGASALAHYKPALAACLDERGHDLHRGAGGYWYTKIVSLFSEKRIEILAVEKSLAPQLWLANSRWYKNGEKFDFVVLPGLDSTAVKEKLGPPDEQFYCANLRIWRYSNGFELP